MAISSSNQSQRKLIRYNGRRRALQGDVANFLRLARSCAMLPLDRPGNSFATGEAAPRESATVSASLPQQLPPCCCSRWSTPTLAIEVTSGMEEGMLGDTPAITEVVIRAYEPIENGLEIETSAAPGEDFDLGEVADSKLLVFELTGKTADGDVKARGRSVAVSLADELPSVLPIFIQRLGGFARPRLNRTAPRTDRRPCSVSFLVLTGGERAMAKTAKKMPPSSSATILLMPGESSASVLAHSPHARDPRRHGAARRRRRGHLPEPRDGTTSEARRPTTSASAMWRAVSWSTRSTQTSPSSSSAAPARATQATRCSWSTATAATSPRGVW
jgi:hypothetical protein